MKILREYIRYLLQERIVNFDGVEYDIPDEEIQRIKDQLQMGYVGIGMDPEPPDRSYDVDETVESVLWENRTSPKPLYIKLVLLITNRSVCYGSK